MPALDQTVGIVQAMLTIGVILNFVLIAFNLLPIPPLDGSHVMKYLLPRPLAIRYVQFGRFGLLALIILLCAWVTASSGVVHARAVAAEILLGIAKPYVVPAAEQWLQ